jgi:hypothetical protein
MVDEDTRVALPVFPQQLGGSHDVGEQEGDGAGGEDPGGWLIGYHHREVVSHVQLPC